MRQGVNGAVELIKNGDASCVVLRDGKVIHSVLSRGIKPMLDAYESGILAGASVADKVVGRAAAMVMALGGACYCYALTVSRGALEVFDKHGISVEYEKKTKYIVNRTGDGMCPMENAVLGVEELNIALCCIKKRLAELSADRDRQ